MTSLTSKQKKHLRGLAHHLNPVATVGQNGVTEAVVKEISRGLDDHELIKVKIWCSDQEELKECMEILSEKLDATLIQVIGHVMVLYRRSQDSEKRIAL